MQIMKLGSHSKYILLGVSLALMLQTNERFVGPIGIGEILAVVFLIIAIPSLFHSKSMIGRPPAYRFTLLYAFIFLFVISPNTFVSVSYNVLGASLVDLLAFAFTLAIALMLPRQEREIQTMVMAFFVALFLSLVFQYFFGGISAYYSMRFTGGAKNPNQLALYMAVVAVLSVWLRSSFHRIIVITLSLLFGIMSASDAFVAGALGSIFMFTLLMLLPPRIIVYFLPIMLAIIYMTVSSEPIMELFGLGWQQADEGGSRAQLYRSAIDAWTDTPISFFIGHGTGSYSGLYGAFGLSEAHNTVLDMATIAGVFGLLLFPILPFGILLKSMWGNHRFASSAFFGLLVFAQFHFVGRQPVFWIAIILFSWFVHLNPIDRRKKTNRNVVLNEARV